MVSHLASWKTIGVMRSPCSPPSVTSCQSTGGRQQMSIFDMFRQHGIGHRWAIDPPQMHFWSWWDSVTRDATQTIQEILLVCYTYYIYVLFWRRSHVFLSIIVWSPVRFPGYLSKFLDIKFTDVPNGLSAFSKALAALAAFAFCPKRSK